jgi:hypothetical protein
MSKRKLLVGRGDARHDGRNKDNNNGILLLFVIPKK